MVAKDRIASSSPPENNPFSAASQPPFPFQRGRTGDGVKPPFVAKIIDIISLMLDFLIYTRSRKGSDRLHIHDDMANRNESLVMGYNHKDPDFNWGKRDSKAWSCSSVDQFDQISEQILHLKNVQPRSLHVLYCLPVNVGSH